MGSLQCRALKNAFQSSCVACCNDTDLCNYDACDHWSQTTRGAHKLVTSAATRTTVPTLAVQINGPDKDHFWKETQIACVTNPAADSYRWKFNGTFSMPMGVTEQLISGQTGGGSGLDILHIKNLTESTFGTYTCAATLNGYTAEQSHFIGILAEKPTVNILKPPVASSFSLQCQVTGYPAPHIQWDFVPKSPRSHGIPPGVQFREEAYKSTLVVSHYNPVDHDGSWYCKAANTAGSTVSEVHIP
ncbi:MAM domain-containing glycosylphosphatidylinositol anchor protein 2-like isoform X3 [Ruditapes philippinarum]|uniref:MAM domain-containing glycosylphosphatidylinositol anchor protein 2-like isoform X3 n=1 Tax=Ruditapes philippinarum TaxID=129788 RepID=UPI00295BAA9B|nr:MAM domain-containing glycosylphosphatidylinositol anchor protein 2-like isoform X3 [Ruditapes philippinarum]